MEACRVRFGSGLARVLGRAESRGSLYILCERVSGTRLDTYVTAACMRAPPRSSWLTVWPMAAFRDRFLTAFGSSP